MNYKSTALSQGCIAAMKVKVVKAHHVTTVNQNYQ